MKMRPIEEVVAGGAASPPAGTVGAGGAARATLPEAHVNPTMAAPHGLPSFPAPASAPLPWLPTDPAAPASRLSPFGETDEQAIERMWDALDVQSLDWRSPELEPIVERLRAARARSAEGAKLRGRKREPQSNQLLVLDVSEIADINWQV